MSDNDKIKDLERALETIAGLFADNLPLEEACDRLFEARTIAIKTLQKSRAHFARDAYEPDGAA